MIDLNKYVANNVVPVGLFFPNGECEFCKCGYEHHSTSDNTPFGRIDLNNYKAWYELPIGPFMKLGCTNCVDSLTIPFAICFHFPVTEEQKEARVAGALAMQIKIKEML